MEAPKESEVQAARVSAPPAAWGPPLALRAMPFVPRGQR